MLEKFESNMVGENALSYKIVALGFFLCDYACDLTGELVEGLGRNLVFSHTQCQGLAQQTLGTILIDVISKNLATKFRWHDKVTGANCSAGRLTRRLSLNRYRRAEQPNQDCYYSPIRPPRQEGSISRMVFH